MNTRANKTLFILLTFLLALVGCVGTVQEAVPPDSLKIVNPPTTFPFPGIVTARAISHAKVELEFYPANGGSDISYKLYVNNALTPIPIDPQSLTQVGGGRYLYTVDSLQADREYKFKITALNTKTAAISTNENEAYARTFDNVVANFNGISKLTLVPGNTDEAVLVDWIAPTMSGIFTAGPYDPVTYEVTVISEIGGAANINNPLYFGTDKRTIYVPTPPARATPLSNPNSTVIDGLMSGTRYFFQVRAINTLYRNYQEAMTNPIPVDRELNTKFLQIKTEEAGTLFDFKQDNVVLSNSPGLDAFDKIDVFWQPGTGSFTGYRVFVRKYDGVGDHSIDDKLTEATLNSMNALGNYYPVTASITTKRVSGLDNYGYYQVKVALCKTISCPVLSSDPNAAIISDLKSIQVKPTLAPFSGVNSVEPPGQYNDKNVVNLKFDAPLINSGFANVIEFYCVDPADHSQMVKFDGATPIAGSTIPRCNGLFLEGAAPPLNTYTSQKIKGLITDGTMEYCFAATPAITGFGPDIRLATSNRIVRCSFPEVFPPTVSQFPGLNNSCAVSAVNGYVTWPLPTGGIYSGFKVFWREKTDVTKFSFPDAIANAPGYFSSPEQSAGTQAYLATNLMPGKTYQIGVLATVDLDDPSKDLYSEYNLRIIDCVVPLPIATFKGFTRIFAVGPKVDGRIPNDPSTKTFPSNAFLYEALDNKGIPYEVALDTMTTPNISTNYQAPPGRDYGVSFGGAFDGIGDTILGYAMSKEGIVSLAWEDVTMSFPEADTLFSTNQPAAPALRTGRKWGYKVYRSSDNKLTWKEITTTNGLIYSMPYTYYPRPNVGSVTTKMAFFTDYSVKAMTETHDEVNGRDVERARTYYYKIVPVFNGQVLNFAIPNHNIVKVTLPPPNMALVHRWMANRAHCLEIDKAHDIAANYSCSYNGIGSRPKSVPYRVGNTALDQGGDILVDRQELGCRYTRGDRVADPETGASIFKLPAGSRRHPDDQNFYPMFTGYRTVSDSVDTSTPFKGCVGQTSDTKGATGTAADYPPGFVADYQHILQGDCIGGHLERIAWGACTAQQYTDGAYNWENIITPGVMRNNATPQDCSVGNPANPTHIGTKYNYFYAPNFVMQSEFMAVFYNNYASSMSAGNKLLQFPAPAVGDVSAVRNANLSWANWLGSSQCSINLAAIDSAGYMRPRWISVNELGHERMRFKDSTGDLLSKTVDEITEVTPSTVEPLAWYNGNEGDPTLANFKLPNAVLRSSPRYRGTTRLAKVMTSNASKLPPLGKLNAEVAEFVCRNYWVQTGVASDNGNFAPDSQPVRKRPLRRVESVTAAAWSETYNEATIDGIEASNTAGSCNNGFRNIAGVQTDKGNFLNNRASVGLNTLNDVPLVTGSSRYNGISAYVETQHTERCISRYGVQDIIGNVSEQNSERIFCDYSQDAAFIGPVTATWSGGTGAENKGDGGPDLNFWNTNDQRSDWGVIKTATLSNGTNTQFELKFRNGSPTRTDLKPWIRISVDSGYCSPVDSRPEKRSGGVDWFKDVATGYWSPLYSPGGALNSNIVERTQVDQESVITWRNGDGRFLDFGPQGLGAPMNNANTLALTGASAKSKYFNPIIGLPLRCENGACNDPLLTTPNDNTSISLPAFAANLTGADDSPTITDFPIGRSVITHLGISDYTYAAAGYLNGTVPTNGSSTGSQVEYLLKSVTVDDPVTMGNPVSESITYPSGLMPGTNFEYYRVVWDVERGSDFAIASGGKSNDSNTGRYTASINRTTVNSSQIGTSNADFASGSRCAILINQDP